MRSDSYLNHHWRFLVTGRETTDLYIVIPHVHVHVLQLKRMMESIDAYLEDPRTERGNVILYVRAGSGGLRTCEAHSMGGVAF